jgi:hypothetical protein
VDEQLHQKLDLAVDQLNIALELFLSGRSYVAALTLAGAAEEILGQALSQRDQQNALQMKFDTTSVVYEELHRKPLAWKHFADGENYAKNGAKHMRSLSESTISVDLYEAALWMLVRACSNYGALDLPRTAHMDRFDDWFYEHVVGI